MKRAKTNKRAAKPRARNFAPPRKNSWENHCQILKKLVENFTKYRFEKKPGGKIRPIGHLQTIYCEEKNSLLLLGKVV